MFDLNELPDDLRDDLPPSVGVENGDLMFYMQPTTRGGEATNAEFVAESPIASVARNFAAPDVEGVQTEEHTLDGTDTLGATGGTIGREGAEEGADNDDEAWSQPKEPSLGMRFDTLQGAREHYNAYALQKGFSIKMNTSKRSIVTGQMEKYQFVCNKFRKPKNDDQVAKSAPTIDLVKDGCEGENIDDEEDSVIIFADDATEEKKKGKKQKREKIIQTGCKAKMIVKFIDGRWEVTYFIAEHNHPLVDKPSLSKYLRSHQGIPPEERLFLTNLHNCNLTTGRMMHIMSEYYGTELIVPYGTKHITNLKSSLNRNATKEGDLIETVAYFEKMQKTDPEFFYKVKYDADDRVENIFWVDGPARKAYDEAYHDCICFDTTYMTNMYNMPFAPFIGINRHGQSFMLGCGFVRQELETSFDWLFGTFLEAMHGRAPDNIITDQDGAMEKSIENIFPTTMHHRCRWHIMKKAQEKLGGMVGRNPGMSVDFNDCINFSFTPEEFEAKWAAFVLKWSIVVGTHFDKLYEYRAMFVPCYFKHRFFPFLQSTQRSEGFNAVLKRYVNPHNSVLNFVKQYEKIQTHVLVREGGNDYRTNHLQAELWSKFPIEKQAYVAYTRDIYHKFRDEFELIGKYNVRPHGGHLYELYPNKEGWVANYGHRSYFVTAEVDAEDYKCECCKMSKDGMLCCHILKKFTHLGIDEIPRQYILRRWTQQAIPGAPTTEQVQPDEMPPESKKQLRHTNLSMDFASLARVASGSDATAAILKKHMRAARTELNHFNKTKKKKAKGPAQPVQGQSPQNTGPTQSAGSPTSPPKHTMPPYDARTVPTARSMPPPRGGATTPEPSGSAPISGVPRDPPKSMTKGRSKSKRIESALELHPKRKNKCSFCSYVDHNAANCPGKLV